MTSNNAHFGLEINGDGERRTLTLAGEMDLTTAPQLADAVEQLCRDGAREIVLDLGNLTFIDSSGVRSLLSAHMLCSGLGIKFVLDDEVPEQVRRVFDVSGVAGLFELE